MIEILTIYGLAFMVLGVAIYVLPRQPSPIRFVAHLPLLAAFGLIHGMLEYAILWKVDRHAEGEGLEWGLALLLFASFLPLFEFGRRTLWANASTAGLYQGQFAPWLYAMLIVTILAVSHLAHDAQTGFVTATRLLLGFPAAILAGFALLGRAAGGSLLPGYRQMSVVAAAAFFGYALLTIVLPGNDPNLPVRFLTHAQFQDIFGIPVQALRALCAFVVALAIVGLVRRMNQDSRERELGQIRATEAANRQLSQEIEQRLRYEEELAVLAVAFETQEAVIITDARATILRVNEAFERITGYAADEMIGKNPALLGSGRHDAEFYRGMWQALQQQGKWAGEVWNRRKGGELYPEWLTIAAVRDRQGVLTHYVGTFSDISSRKQAEEEIRQLALYDPLTRLPNRRLLRDRLMLAFNTSMRSRNHGAVIFIDLDNFKNINDTKGHEVGDQLLVEVARRLAGSVRESDTVARVGGDEFVLVLTDLDIAAEVAATQVERVAEKILTSLRQAYDLGGFEYVCSASLGISLFINHEMGVDELFRRADTAMYRAKASGKNAFCFFDPEMQSALESRMLMENDLRNAVANGQFQLYFQSQEALAKHRVWAELIA